jgi:hypothetical protein
VIQRTGRALAAVPIAVAVWIASPALANQAHSPPSLAQIGRTIDRDIQQWKLARSKPDALNTESQNLERDARQFARGPRPRSVSTNDWVKIRTALTRIADGAATTAHGLSVGDQTLVETGGRGVAGGAQAFADAAGTTGGRKPGG